MIKELYPFVVPFIGTITAVFVAGFGVVQFVQGRLDKKVDKEAFAAECQNIQIELMKTEERFSTIQKTLLDIHGMASRTKGVVEGINKRLDKLNGGHK